MPLKAAEQRAQPSGPTDPSLQHDGLILFKPPGVTLLIVKWGQPCPAALLG